MGEGSSERSDPAIIEADALNGSKEQPLCPSTNTFEKSAKPALKRLSSTSNRKSPAPVAPAKKPPSSFRSSPPQTAPEMGLPPNLPPRPVAAAPKWHSHFWLCAR